MPAEMTGIYHYTLEVNSLHCGGPFSWSWYIMPALGTRARIQAMIPTGGSQDHTWAFVRVRGMKLPRLKTLYGYGHGGLCEHAFLVLQILDAHPVTPEDVRKIGMPEEYMEYIRSHQ